MTHRLLFLLAVLSLGAAQASAQSVDAVAAVPSPKYEFRGAWIATVSQLDWPRGSTPEAQQRDLETLLDRLQEAGINAVFFQVRPECDALYDSSIEPWSAWLTGTQGQAPEPFYDPLAFAVEAAHRRGMELHAWFNPFRAERSIGSYPLDTTHVAVRHPEWTFSSGSIRILDPGLPDVRDYVARVVMDVVRRYEVDGIHFDDYFYPYPPNQITNQDDATFAAHNRGFSNRGAWRRDNVNLFVKQVADSIQSVKPHLKFGISPFGIWKNGVPPGIVGLDAYNVIYADPLAWVDEGSVDYLVPQLYWPFGGGQDYARLAPWWASASADRHLYTGHAAYRIATFPQGEIQRQVRFNRDQGNIEGSVFFRARNITLNLGRIADSLETDLFRKPALTTPMAWKDLTPPAPPVDLRYAWTSDTTISLTWRAPVTDEGPPARRYAVYRMRSQVLPDFEAGIQQDGTLIAVTADTTAVDAPGRAPDPYYYVVTSVSSNSIDSAPSNFVSLEGRAVAAEADEIPAAFVLHDNYPNPFNPTTTLSFTLPAGRSVSLRVYDAMGRLVRTLVHDAYHGPGTHRVSWDAVDERGVEVASGVYLYTLETGTDRETKAMVLMR